MRTSWRPTVRAPAARSVRSGPQEVAGRCPAVRLPDGQCLVVRPPSSHKDIVKAARAAGYRKEVNSAQFGYMTPGGLFRPLDRVWPVRVVRR